MISGGFQTEPYDNSSYAGYPDCAYIDWTADIDNTDHRFNVVITWSLKTRISGTPASSDPYTNIKAGYFSVTSGYGSEVYEEKTTEKNCHDGTEYMSGSFTLAVQPGSKYTITMEAGIGVGSADTSRSSGSFDFSLDFTGNKWFVKNNGEWIEATPYVKSNGAWSTNVLTYAKAYQWVKKS